MKYYKSASKMNILVTFFNMDTFHKYNVSTQKRFQ